MKKYFFFLLTLLFSIPSFAQKETPACAVMKKLATLAAADQLCTLAQKEETTIKYYQPFDEMKLMTVAPQLQGVLHESVSIETNVKGGNCSYRAFLKDYGKSEQAAKKDFAQLRAKYIDCFPKENISADDELGVSAFLPNCRVMLSTYENSFTGTWVAYVWVRHTNK